MYFYSTPVNPMIKMCMNRKILNLTSKEGYLILSDNNLIYFIFFNVFKTSYLYVDTESSILKLDKTIIIVEFILEKYIAVNIIYLFGYTYYFSDTNNNNYPFL